MTLLQRIDNDLKEAMKAKNEAALSTLRMVRAACKNKQIELGHELNDEEAGAVMRTMVKQYRDALQDFTAAGRSDLMQKQTQEIEFIERYLPAQLNAAQIEEISRNVIAELQATPSDMGKVMGAVMKQVAGQADGALVRSVIQGLLK